jgi:small-conductance mechanosensitive channel
MLRRFISYTTLLGFVLLFILSACSGAIPTQTLDAAQIVTPSPASTQISAAASENGTPVPTATPLLAEMIPTRVLEPTATPGALQQQVMNFTVRAGLATTRFLGLSVADWINLGISLVFILIGYTLGTWIIRSLLPRLARRTPSVFDDEFLKAVGPDIRWFVVVLTISYSTTRLTFFSPSLKIVLKDIYFVVGLFLVVRITMKLVDLATEWYQERLVEQGRGDELAPIILIATRLSHVLIGMVGITILLAHFGINVTALTAALGLGGLAISLAARDTIADAIAGVILLFDRPFRIGDRIEIQGVGTWGDVTDIGLRTTRIRTRDNRMVIVPNSIISHNQVINYTYPDPRYRIETHVGVAYGTDVERVRTLLIDTVKVLEFVLPDKPVDALYIDMGDSAMIFRVRWWIESYVDTRRAVDRVHTALQKTLDEAGIECPFPTQSLDMRFRPETVEQFSQALRGQDTSNRLSRTFKSQGMGSEQGEEDATSAGMGQDEQ